MFEKQKQEKKKNIERKEEKKNKKINEQRKEENLDVSLRTGQRISTAQFL